MVVEAAGHLQRALELQPDNARACYYLGDALNQAADLPGARRALQRAVELDPRDPKAHHLLGRVLDRLGCPDEAREMYQRSRELAGA
jgi:Flp pilus assembly protein TadD